ncbi:MAG: metallophosphoesterase [Polaromonas sp.]|uniref:metallophosphoesterase n=1 Tax=Polaromonas sp. TaxID=1869339 RepID=UPI0025DD7522|nr:metallophosphoesterase [Polaromonas sp.]MBI2727711.1 metallophosphoesterase [Polaromonas sp.]
MRFYPLAAFAALLHAYIGWRIVPGLGAYPRLQVLMLALLVLSSLLMPLGLAAGRTMKQPWADRLSWIGLLLMGLFSSLFVMTLVRDAALLVLWLASAAGLPLPLQSVSRVSAEAVPALALLVTVLGFLNARRTPAVVRVDVPIHRLPSALHGFTVAQLSDIHIGPTIKRAWLQRIVSKVNGLEADMVAVTGDLVDGRVADLAGHIAPLADLKSRHGTYVVTGNHEYYSGAHAWVAELRRMGLTVLMNEHVVLHHGKPANTAMVPHGDPQDDSQIMAPLVLAGVTDYSAHHFDESHRSDPKAALEGAPQTAPVRLLLAHQPRSAAAAAEAGFDLQLSGHTHGGQFYPWNLFVQFQQPFSHGLHRLKDLWVYTSRGTGYWGPPKRFGAPSEISLIRLVTA